jgi:ABC-type branched-chain amino acid transport systems, ATPase component
MISLTVEDLTAGYGDLRVLRDVNLKVPEGRLMLVIGPNGSGKSTLLKTIYGLTKVFSGRIILGEREITRLKPHEIAKAGVGYVMQRRSVFPHLTVMENLRMGGWTIKGRRREARAEHRKGPGALPPAQELLDRKASS